MSHLSYRRHRLSFNDLSHIRSAEDLFALALAVEREGVRRYEDLHQQMLVLGNAPLAELFASLRDQEQGHGDSVDLLALRAGLGPIPHLSFAWDDLPEGQMPQSCSTLTPLVAVRHALRNEQRTYALFLKIAASTHVAEIRHQAELLASEELEHIAQLARRELEIEDAQSHILTGTPLVPPRAQRNIDAIRSMAATDAWISAGRRAALAAQLRSRGERWVAGLLQDLAETAEARSRCLGVHSPLSELPAALIPQNDNLCPTAILEQESGKTREAMRGFMRLASGLGVNGLASFANHEADIRLGALAQMTDCMASFTYRRRNTSDERDLSSQYAVLSFP